MPAIIVFDSSQSPKSPGQADTIRVAEDADAVAEKLNSATGSIASLELPENRGRVWVNRDLVRMVREVRGQK